MYCKNPLDTINLKSCLICKQNHNLELWSEVKDEEYFTSKKTFQYYLCKNCYNISINPVPEGELDIIYPNNYYSYSNKNNSSLLEKIKNYFDNKIFKKVLKSIHDQKISVLDIGGGSGWLLNQIKKIEKRVLYTQVVDLDPAAESIARENGHEFYLGNINNYKTEKKFDLILMLNILEHIKDPEDVLIKLKALLKPHGKILIKTPNWDSLDSKMFRSSYWGGLHAPRHWVIFCKKSLLKIVKEVGLNLESFSYTQGAPFWSVSLVSMLGKKRIIKLNKNTPLIYYRITSMFMGVFALIDFIRLPFMKTSQMILILSNEK